MNPIRLALGAFLLCLCVFGLPEGCLVLGSHAVVPSLPISRPAPPGSSTMDPPATFDHAGDSLLLSPSTAASRCTPPEP
jgi:hypothetical protein